MNSNTGEMRVISPSFPLREDEVRVPVDQEERVLHMNRAMRREWAREELKRIRKAAKGK